MKKNVIIILMCLLFISCWKTNPPEEFVYKPGSVVQFEFGGQEYIFSGNEIKTYHKPGDSVYGFVCETNKMKFGFEFKSNGFDKDSLLILNKKDFRFWQGYLEYEAGEFGYIIHCQKRDGNFFSGYFNGNVTSHALFTSSGLYGHFDLLFFKND